MDLIKKYSMMSAEEFISYCITNNMMSHHGSTIYDISNIIRKTIDYFKEPISSITYCRQGYSTTMMCLYMVYLLLTENNITISAISLNIHMSADSSSRLRAIIENLGLDKYFRFNTKMDITNNINSSNIKFHSVQNIVNNITIGTFSNSYMFFDNCEWITKTEISDYIINHLLPSSLIINTNITFICTGLPTNRVISDEIKRLNCPNHYIRWYEYKHLDMLWKLSKIQTFGVNRFDSEYELK